MYQDTEPHLCGDSVLVRRFVSCIFAICVTFHALVHDDGISIGALSLKAAEDPQRPVEIPQRPAGDTQRPAEIPQRSAGIPQRRVKMQLYNHKANTYVHIHIYIYIRQPPLWGRPGCEK